MSEIGPILIAEDDKVANARLSDSLQSWGFSVISTSNGVEAFDVFKKQPVSLVITDWIMPQMDGIELCRKLRSLELDRYVYIIFLTIKTKKRDTVIGLKAGADDYLYKPFDNDELEARLRAAERVLRLEQELRGKNRVLSQMVAELEGSTKKIEQIEGLLPICMHCKKIRDDKDYWHQLDVYLLEHSKVDFTHGICPECFDKHYGKIEEEM